MWPCADDDFARCSECNAILIRYYCRFCGLDFSTT